MSVGEKRTDSYSNEVAFGKSHWRKTRHFGFVSSRELVDSVVRSEILFHQVCLFIVFSFYLDNVD